MPAPLPPTLEKVAPPQGYVRRVSATFTFLTLQFVFPTKYYLRFFLTSQVRRWLVPRGTENNTNAQYCGENKTAE